MARVSGSSNGPSKAPKKKKPAPARKAAAKKSIPGYKVPKKLLKPTKSNKKAGLPSLASVLKKQDASIKKYNEAKKPKTKKPAAKPTTTSTDWEKGMSVRDWARGQDWYKGKP